MGRMHAHGQPLNRHAESVRRHTRFGCLQLVPEVEEALRLCSLLVNSAGVMR